MQSIRPRLLALAGMQLRGPLPAAGKKASKDKGPKKTGELSKEVATGCGLMKGQNDPPILPDDQYPAWLWTLLQPQPLVSELRTAYEGPGLTVAAMRRLWHYSNKQRIKERNTMKAKQ